MRIDVLDDGRDYVDTLEGGSDYKVFASLADARARFEEASSYVWVGELKRAFLFSVEGVDNPRLAVEAVKSGQAILVDRDQKERSDKNIQEHAREVVAKLFPTNQNK